MRTFRFLLLATSIACLFIGRISSAADARSFHVRCESADGGAQVDAVRFSSISAGELTAPARLSNRGSWQFDGHSSIAYAIPSDTNGFSENFTWEGFFLFPASNQFLTETGIADRLLTQFAFDKGDWTRLAIGLVAGDDRLPRLGVELEGFDGRTFGLGNRIVAADRWHHFALVHEGTAAAATIRWYLDYELTAELYLGGQSNQNTLRPPGAAPMAIGARLKRGSQVNRGFDGLIDELRLTPRPLGVEEFLRCDSEAFATGINTARIDQRKREEFWEARHAWAREQSRQWSVDRPDGSNRVASPKTDPPAIDGFFEQPSRTIDDAGFLRRLSLTVRGRVASLDEVITFLEDQHPAKRSRAIDEFLASPEWADAWVGYWQDVLAENPSVVFPTLNNSGAFRGWVYQSFCQNKPFDRFVTELLLLKNEPGDVTDGPAGFALATGNDVPMAMRAHVAMKAFAAVDLKCARCHDSPLDDYRQLDLFLLAAYLNDAPLEVPATSLAAISKSNAITTSLVPGQIIDPKGLDSHWLHQRDQPGALMPIEPNSRAHLAALITSPRNSRFSDVITNRIWKRCFGQGLVEPVDRWSHDHAENHPELLRLLSAELIENQYDLKAITRKILRSRQWQRVRAARRQMSAEQLVDSLFLIAGKDFQAETMGVHATDPGAVQLPKPHRAWQFAALPNERDRPALGMPVSQTIVDVMKTFGWTGNRLQPISEREGTTSPLQPLTLFNGLMSQRIIRLSDQSAITELCLQEIDVKTLVDRLFMAVLGRMPEPNERQVMVAYLRPGFERRLTGKPAHAMVPLSTFQPDWRKHLEAEQTTLMLDAQRRVARGEQPTARLKSDFRQRVEDVLWALINAPEFVVIP